MKPANTRLSDRPEWGKLNSGQGYAVVAWDMERAFACAALRKREGQLVEHVQERTWGVAARGKRRGEPWPDAAPAAVNKARLARALDPENADNVRKMIDRAEKKLLADRILIKSAAGLLINLEVDQWKRLTPADLRYCALAQTWRRAPRRAGPPPLLTSSDPPLLVSSEPPLLTSSDESDSRVAVPLIGTHAEILPIGRDTPCGVRAGADTRHEARAEVEEAARAFAEWEASPEGRWFDDGQDQDTRGPGSVLRLVGAAQDPVPAS